MNRTPIPRRAVATPVAGVLAARAPAIAALVAAALVVAVAVVSLVGACDHAPPSPKIAPCASPSGVVTVTAQVEHGRAVPEPHRVAVPLHSRVEVRVGADQAVPVHIHGYDIEYDAAPGAPGCVSFVADRAGLFDVEAHPDTLLVQLEVR